MLGSITIRVILSESKDFGSIFPPRVILSEAKDL